MQHPFQCIASIQGENHGYLITACGPRLVVTKLATSETVCEWTAEETSIDPENTTEDTEERPAKKQKTSNDENATVPSLKKPKAKKAAPKASNIIKVTVSPSQDHIVTVMDDKSIRVFSLSSGNLTELSRRCMPKRPCAIQVLPDNETILVGDKFGDVYSLPLLPSTAKPESKPAATESTPQPEGEFKPSATPLTVHSRRNLLALDQQKKQKNFTPRKDTLSTFENTLLLGHVSMLTDMTFATATVEGKERRYILTADRDEHIRISRAAPQSHVIEGYCLGHTAFISKICQVGKSELLVSGGGDPWLGVWDWAKYEMKRKFDLLALVQKVAPEDTQIAVSGIWSLGEDGVLVICEKVKALFYVPRVALELEAGQGVQTIPLSQCPLDVVIAEDGKIFVSTDARLDGEKRLICGTLGSSGWEECWAEKLQGVNGYAGSKRVWADKEMDAFLYNVANLRKRGALEGEEGEAADGEEAD